MGDFVFMIIGGIVLIIIGIIGTMMETKGYELWKKEKSFRNSKLKKPKFPKQ